MGQTLWNRGVVVLARLLAICAGVVGFFCIGAYVTTVIPLWVHDAPDKSLTFWNLIFLFIGIFCFRIALFFWRASRR